jgi:DNA modification methylase
MTSRRKTAPQAAATAPAWPADHVERWPLTRLIPYARNARTHSDAQVAQIAASIREWGWTTPVLVDEAGTIIAGHGRVLAARQLGITEAPVIIARGWTEAQRRAYTLADNKLALNAGWDEDLLKLELGELRADGFDLGLIGFSDDDLAPLLLDAAGGLTDPDEVPDVQPDPITRRGDVWIMGRHRLMCGDSTSADDVARLMAGQSADLCFTSPPYAQQRDYTEGVSDWDALMQGVFAALPVTHEAQVLVNLGLVHREGEWLPYWDDWIAWMREQGWRRFGWYVWDQGFGLPGSWGGRLAPSHEWVFHFNRVAERARKTVGKRPENIGRQRAAGCLRAKDGSKHPAAAVETTTNPRKIPDSVIRVTRQTGALGDGMDHPAVFPVDLPGEFINAFSDPDDLVYEPFCGSGTQLIAAQKNGRSCFGMEIAPQYCDVAIRRWQTFSGQSATHEASGRSFADMEAERTTPAAA